jgi:hypothetical protein
MLSPGKSENFGRRIGWINAFTRSGLVHVTI